MKQAAKKRTYLAKDDRHAALLDTAAAVVEARGWPALTMISVAEHAKVSRQLVYEHFSSIDDLMTQTMTHIFRDTYERVRETITRSPANILDLMESVGGMTFELSPGRVRALWQMITGTYSSSEETARMSRRLRHLLTNLWAPVAEESFGLPQREGRALIWMMHMAFWGAHHLVEAGEVDRPTANKLLLWMMGQVEAGTVMSVKPAPSAKRPKA
jgi:AcrR family transcriptional regulator